MGYFSRREFTAGLKLLNATTLDKLRKVQPFDWHSKLFHAVCITPALL